MSFNFEQYSAQKNDRSHKHNKKKIHLMERQLKATSELRDLQENYDKKENEVVELQSEIKTQQTILKAKRREWNGEPPLE